MSTRLYYVNPANIADITFVGHHGITTKVVLPDGRPVELLQHEPAWDVYYAVEDNTLTPQYHTFDMSADMGVAFLASDDPGSGPGTPKSAEARVHETRNFQRLPIEDLYDAKKSEIAEYDQEVAHNAIPSSLHPTWLFVTNPGARQELGSQAMALAAGTPFPSNADKHPFVAIYNPDNTVDPYRRVQVNETSYRTLTREVAEHDQERGNATENSANALQATYNGGAGDWQAVADHDPRDPAWGYPTYTPIQSQHIV